MSFETMHVTCSYTICGNARVCACMVWVIHFSHAIGVDEMISRSMYEFIFCVQPRSFLTNYIMYEYEKKKKAH